MYNYWLNIYWLLEYLAAVTFKRSSWLVETNFLEVRLSFVNRQWAKWKTKARRTSTGRGDFYDSVAISIPFLEKQSPFHSDCTRRRSCCTSSTKAWTDSRCVSSLRSSPTSTLPCSFDTRGTTGAVRLTLNWPRPEALLHPEALMHQPTDVSTVRWCLCLCWCPWKMIRSSSAWDAATDDWSSLTTMVVSCTKSSVFPPIPTTTLLSTPDTPTICNMVAPFEIWLLRFLTKLVSLNSSLGRNQAEINSLNTYFTHSGEEHYWNKVNTTAL